MKSGWSRRTFRHAAEYAALRTAVWGLTRLPYDRSLAVGRRLAGLAAHEAPEARFGLRRLGRWVGRALRRRREIALENLSHAFPEWPVARRERVVKEHFEHLAMSLVEFAQLASPKSESVHARVTVEGREHYESAKAKGRGVIIICPHFGNWELVGATFPRVDPDMSAIVFPQSNPLADAFIGRVRAGQGLSTIPTGLATRRALEALKRGGGVGFLADQDAGSGGVFVKFFGRPASTAKGPMLVARRTGAAVVMTLMVREPAGCHRMIISPEIPVPRDREEETDIVQGTQYWSALLEGWVRRYPPLWFWVHRRWKTQPPPALGVPLPGGERAGVSGR